MWQVHGTETISLDLLLGPTLVQSVLGFSWCATSCGKIVSAIFRRRGHWHNWLASTFSGPEPYPSDIMDHCIRRLPNPPRTVQELTNALVEIWQDINLGTIRKLIRSMPRRCNACIQAHGDHTRYQCVISIWLNEWSQFRDKSVSRLSLCFSTWFWEFLVK